MTPAGAAALAQTVPLLVKTWPDAPGAAVVTAPVPAPSRTPLAVCVAAPLPPWATVNGVVSPVNEVMLELAPAPTPPNAVRAAPAVDDPVPPDATARGVVPKVSPGAEILLANAPPSLADTTSLGRKAFAT